MSDSLLTLAGVSIGGRDALAAGGVLALALLLAILLATARLTRARALEAAAAAERQRELDDKMAELARMNAELAGRMRAMSEVVADRLETVSSRVGAGIEQGARATAEQLARLGERLAVIDRAQMSLSALSQEMVGLKHILSNKQTRGAFGQGRMEAIVRDGLPTSAFTFQATLSSGARPDCLIRLPGDERPLAVDAKFPLEAVTEWRDAGDAEQRKARKRPRARRSWPPRARYRNESICFPEKRRISRCSSCPPKESTRICRSTSTTSRKKHPQRALSSCLHPC
jgi:DNA recombination protein RmuC